MNKKGGVAVFIILVVFFVFLIFLAILFGILEPISLGPKGEELLNQGLNATVFYIQRTN